MRPTYPCAVFQDNPDIFYSLKYQIKEGDCPFQSNKTWQDCDYKDSTQAVSMLTVPEAPFLSDKRARLVHQCWRWLTLLAAFIGCTYTLNCVEQSNAWCLYSHIGGRGVERPAGQSQTWRKPSNRKGTLVPNRDMWARPQRGNRSILGWDLGLVSGQCSCFTWAVLSTNPALPSTSWSLGTSVLPCKGRSNWLHEVVEGRNETHYANDFVLITRGLNLMPTLPWHSTAAGLAIIIEGDCDAACQEPSQSPHNPGSHFFNVKTLASWMQFEHWNWEVNQKEFSRLIHSHGVHLDGEEISPELKTKIHTLKSRHLECLPSISWILVTFKK